jgi:hypothetical protein
LYFAYTAKATYDQMLAYRYAANVKADGTKKEKEEVFKLKDELPDGLRYLVMGWPELPKTDGPAMTAREQSRWDAMDDRTRLDIERVREFNKQSAENDLKPGETGFPLGGFFGTQYAEDWMQ